MAKLLGNESYGGVGPTSGQMQEEAARQWYRAPKRLPSPSGVGPTSGQYVPPFKQSLPRMSDGKITGNAPKQLGTGNAKLGYPNYKGLVPEKYPKNAGFSKLGGGALFAATEAASPVGAAIGALSAGGDVGQAWTDASANTLTGRAAQGLNDLIYQDPNKNGYTTEDLNRFRAARMNATIPSASVPSKSVYPSYIQKAPVVNGVITPSAPATPTAPAMAGNVMKTDNTSSPASQAYIPQYRTDPRALETWMSQQRQLGREVELGDVAGYKTPDVGVVGNAYSNVKGTPSLRPGGMMPTQMAINALEAPRSPFRQSTMAEVEEAKKRYEEWKKGTPMRERVPVDTRELKQFEANKAFKQRQSEAEASRANELAIAKEAARGQIGKAEEERKQAEQLAEATTTVKKEAQITAANKARADVIGDLLKAAETPEEKAFYAKELAKLGGITTIEPEQPTAEPVDIEAYRAKARAAGMKKFKVGGKTYDV